MKQLFILFVCGTLLCVPTKAQTKSISKSEYRDKVTAMIIGSIGATTTGYEYAHETCDAGNKCDCPTLLGIDDSYFNILNGTLGGSRNFGQNVFNIVWRDGYSYSDDDQHVDFLNQYILNTYGASVGYQQIRDKWVHHQLSDFGATYDAMAIIKDKNLIAPLCGQKQHGNNGGFLPESYIETETMGAAFPGLPNKAAAYAEKFGSLSGQGDPVIWGRFWAASTSMAFFESDIRTVIDKAAAQMPLNSWPREIYSLCLDLKKKYPDDWRSAVRELWDNGRLFYHYNCRIMMPDVNNGNSILAILYGNNDYMTTLKIISLAGGDAECGGSAICGIMGILKGLEGSPSEFKERLYKNGEGIWVNDLEHDLCIRNDFPTEIKITELVDVYQKNAEKMIRAFGGYVTETDYIIPEDIYYAASVGTTNWDFESGNIDGWETWKNGTASIWAEKQMRGNMSMSASGYYKGTIITDKGSEAKLFQRISGLKPNQTYKIEARINTTSGKEARLYAENYGGGMVYTSQACDNWPYRYLYVTTGTANTSMEVGLYCPVSDFDGTQWSNIDDLVITEINSQSYARYEAEDAAYSNAVAADATTASGGKYVGWINYDDSFVEFTVDVPYSGEHIVRIHYGNGGNYALQSISVNGTLIGKVGLPATGPWTNFGETSIDAPVSLSKGKNTIRLAYSSEYAEIDCIDLVSETKKPYTDAGDIISGGIYKIVSVETGKVLSMENGEISNGSMCAQSDYTAAATQFFRITNEGDEFFSIKPVQTNRSIEINGCRSDIQAKLGIWDYWAGDCQKWFLLGDENGIFYIMNGLSGSLIAADKNSNGILQQTERDVNAKWRFEFIGTDESDLPQSNTTNVKENCIQDDFSLTSSKPGTITITAGVSGIGSLTNSTGISRSIEWEAGSTDIENLSSGLYIINGKKALVK